MGLRLATLFVCLTVLASGSDVLGQEIPLASSLGDPFGDVTTASSTGESEALFQNRRLSLQYEPITQAAYSDDQSIPPSPVDDTTNSTAPQSAQRPTDPTQVFRTDSDRNWISKHGNRSHTEMGTVHFPEHLGTIRLPEMPRQEPYHPNMPPKEREVKVEFSDGLTIKTADDYFSLTFHNLTQIDYRDFQKTGDPLVDSFVVPRQRWYFLGNVSPNVRYYTVINRGYNSLDVLDAFVDLNFGLIEREKFQIRVGRTKTPYSYEYIKVSEADLVAAERSVFIGNLATNREEGLMAHGKLLDRSFEYAVGVFNGPRRSFVDSNDAKDLFTFFNYKPFLHGDSEVARQFNFSGSFNFGNQHNPAQPDAFRTSNDQATGTSVAQVSPTFLQFNDTTFEDGMRMQWSADVAYYYKSFGMLAGYQGAFQDYGVSSTPIPSDFVGVTSANRVRVPMSGYSVTAYYFVTGEEITRRANVLEPRRPFSSLRSSNWSGPGAIELFGRFANMQIGNNVFTGGLADPAKWSNRADVTDLGVNWYLNHYTKLTFDWQFSNFGTPVYLSPTSTTRFNNLFWFRTQIFF